jgi:hypothetical protein
VVTYFLMLSSVRLKLQCGAVAALVLVVGCAALAQASPPSAAVAPLTWEQFEARRAEDRSRRASPVEPGGDSELLYGTLIVVADPHGGHFDYDQKEALSHLPRYPRRPREVAQALEDAYGADSLITRGAKSLAMASDAAERTTQKPLDGVSALTNALVKTTGGLLGVDEVPEVTFRSRTAGDRFGIGVEAAW